MKKLLSRSLAILALGVVLSGGFVSPTPSLADDHKCGGEKKCDGHKDDTDKKCDGHKDEGHEKH